MASESFMGIWVGDKFTIETMPSLPPLPPLPPPKLVAVIEGIRILEDAVVEVEVLIEHGMDRVDVQYLTAAEVYGNVVREQWKRRRGRSLK